MYLFDRLTGISKIKLLQNYSSLTILNQVVLPKLLYIIYILDIESNFELTSESDSDLPELEVLVSKPPEPSLTPIVVAGKMYLLF
jgi:hypothetical protein